MLLSIYNNALHWLEANMLSCPSKKYLHIECPGCGMQRSFIALLKGNFADSFHLYPATIPILFIVGFTIAHLKYKFASGATTIKYLYIFTAIVISVFYIYKIINHKIIA